MSADAGLKNVEGQPSSPTVAANKSRLDGRLYLNDDVLYEQLKNFK